MKLRRIVTFGASAGALALASALAACGAFGDRAPTISQPGFYRDLATGASLDAAGAAAMISNYRTNNGLPPVTLDPALMKMADEQARAMAARNKLDHDVIGPFAARLKRSGFDAAVGAENISAGYHTMAEAFSGWRDSPHHKANMLLRTATRMGIAAVYVPGTKYKVFWALVLAAPDEKRS
jgi:uncharacterized protein YkwD